MPSFSQTELNIIKLFPIGASFVYEDKSYRVVLCDKPTITKGECKTDVYIKAISDKEEKELKISVKQTNADFLENKMKLERAHELFGDQAEQILSQSIQKILPNFRMQPLVFFSSYGKTAARTIKLGWKFDLCNKVQGDLSGELLLSEQQIIDVYSGTNLPASKRDAVVNGIIQPNSGIANFMLVVNPDEKLSAQECINRMVPINEYIKRNNCKIFFACKALNYRADDEKWDGNRPLAVYVDWSIDKSGKITAELVFDHPLFTKGNEVGNRVVAILRKMHVNNRNFEVLKQYLDPNIRILR